MTFLDLLFALIVLGVILFVVRLIPVIEPWIKNIVYVVVLLAFAVWILSNLGGSFLNQRIGG